MAYAIRTIEPNLVLLRFSDPFQPGDIVAALRAILALHGRLRGIKIFCDASDATPGSLSFSDMKGVFDFVRERIDDFAGTKWATYSRGLLNFGFARMAGELAGGLPFEYRAFRDQDLAFNWLCVPPAMLAQARQDLPVEAG
jgi:hypothetical protein